MVTVDPEKDVASLPSPLRHYPDITKSNLPPMSRTLGGRKKSLAGYQAQSFPEAVPGKVTAKRQHDASVSSSSSGSPVSKKRRKHRTTEPADLPTPGVPTASSPSPSLHAPCDRRRATSRHSRRHAPSSSPATSSGAHGACIFSLSPCRLRLITRTMQDYCHLHPTRMTLFYQPCQSQPSTNPQHVPSPSEARRLRK